MTYGDLVSHVKFDMERDSPFSYARHACNRCCRNKAIRVSPYEILRLARHLCISTTQFIEDHTEAAGTVLRSKGNGDCGFLCDRGWIVHLQVILQFCSRFELQHRSFGELNFAT